MIVQRTFYTMGVLLIINVTAMSATVMYWFWFGSQSPVTVTYQHPRFMTAPAKDQEEAKKFELVSARSGQVVYRYVEWCLDRNVSGEIQGSWSDGTLAYMLPDVKSIGIKGCWKRSLPLTVPHVPFTTTLVYRQKTVHRVNPLRDSIYINDSIKINVEP